MKKKVIVIGGGIAGLSAGVYAQKCGFDVTILESHSIAGGNCTSWRRGGYLFEGGMHWLSGSAKNEILNKMWRHIGALDDSVTIHCKEPFIEFDYKDTQGRSLPMRLYRDVNLTERHLLELSPADAKEIRRFCNNIRKIKNLVTPITDLHGVKVTKKLRIPLSLLFSAISGLGVMASLSKFSRDEYINRFSHEGIRELIRAFTFEKSGILPLVFTMGSLTRGDGGFPQGGSLPFVERIVKTFTGMGGELICNTKADKVIIENYSSTNGRRAVGVTAGGKKIPADAVIVTADTMAIDHLFEMPLCQLKQPGSKWLDEMRANTEPTMATFVCLGINADLRKYHYYYAFKLKTPIKLSDQVYEYFNVSNYASDSDYSPNGKTALTIQLPGDTYEFWKRAKEEDRYIEEKKKIADTVIAAIYAQIPEADGKAEIIDVATPLTYERYCANWKGSWMTEMKPGMKMKTYPAVTEGLHGVYFAGHRLSPPGGLPVALLTARAAVQYLCRDTETLFVSED